MSDYESLAEQLEDVIDILRYVQQEAKEHGIVLPEIDGAIAGAATSIRQLQQ